MSMISSFRHGEIEVTVVYVRRNILQKFREKALHLTEDKSGN